MVKQISGDGAARIRLVGSERSIMPPLITTRPSATANTPTTAIVKVTDSTVW